MHTPSWSGDGRWLIFCVSVGGSPDIYGYQPSIDSAPTPLVATDFVEQSPALSPDGRWLAYESNRSGRLEVYVRPFPNADDSRWQVSTRGGSAPLWAHNGHELFYRSDDDQLIAVEYTSEPAFRTLTERPLFYTQDYGISGFEHAYAVGVDDRRFLMLRELQGVRRGLSLVFKLFDELKQRVGNGND